MIFDFKKNSVNKLADIFPTDNLPVDKAVLKTTVQVGKIHYRNCAAFYLNQEGFYLRIKFVFKTYPDIFIPWQFINEIKQSKLYSLKAIQFVLSDTSLPLIKICKQFFNGKFIN